MRKSSGNNKEVMGDKIKNALMSIELQAYLIPNFSPLKGRGAERGRREGERRERKVVLWLPGGRWCGRH